MTSDPLHSPVLLVQCCDLPQFFFIAAELHRKHPETEFHALLLEHPDTDYYLDHYQHLLPVHFTSLPEERQNYRDIIFPLLNRGYSGIKRRAASLPGRHWECDYDGDLKELNAVRLWLSYLTAPHAANAAFIKFLRSFPQRPVQGSVLVVHSSHPSLQRRCAEPLEALLSEASRVVHLEADSYRQARRDLKGKTFDSAVIFFSGEKGFLHLKLLPFLCRVPTIVVFDEGGNYFYASFRKLLRFALMRVLHGVEQPSLVPSILLLQTETREYVAGAAKTLRLERLYPRARIVVLCKEEDQEFLSGVPEIDEVIGYRRTHLFFKAFQLVRDLNPEIVSAVFSGRPVYRAMKAVFLGIFDRPQLAFNAQLDCYWVTPRTLAKLPVKGTLQYGLDKTPEPRVVLLQTERLTYLKEVIQRLRGPKFFPNAKLLVVTPQENEEEVAGLPEVDEVLTWKTNRQLWALRKKIRSPRPEGVVASFTGQPGLPQAKLLFLSLRKIPRCVFNARLDAYWLAWGKYRNLFRSEPLLFVQGRRRERILLLQTEGWRSVAEAARRITSESLFPSAEVTVFCKREAEQSLAACEAISHLEFYSRPGLRGWLLDRKRIRHLRPDVISAIFSGRRVFPTAKTLFLTSRCAPRLVFNARLDAYWLTWRTPPNLFRHESFLLVTPGGKRKVVLLQTESWRNVAEAANRLDSEKLFPNSEVIVFCRQEAAAKLRRSAAISRVEILSEKGVRGVWRDLKAIRNVKPDALAAIFANRRSFLSAKTTFLLSRSVPRLVFNGRLDCYWMSLRTWPRLLHREPALFDEKGARPSDVLLIQTEEEEETTRALQIMIESQAVPTRKAAIFCSTEATEHFIRHPLVDRVFAYRKGDFRQNLSLLLRLRREHWDVVAAIFSGRPVYRPQKTLFRFLPARHRLAFNASLDCFYLPRSRAARNLGLPSLYVPGSTVSTRTEIPRKLIRGLLFLPRFIYLMAWLSVMKLRRASLAEISDPRS